MARICTLIRNPAGQVATLEIQSTIRVNLNNDLRARLPMLDRIRNQVVNNTLQNVPVCFVIRALSVHIFIKHNFYIQLFKL